MEEVENQDMNQEVVNPETEATQTPVAQDSAREEANERNWRNLRKAKEDAERRAYELEQRTRMQDEMLKRFATQQQPVEPEVDSLNELAKQDYVEGEKVAKALRDQERRFNQQLEEIKKVNNSQRQNSLINDLRREYSDFDQVVNSETLSLLEETNPRLAQAIAASNDPYHIAVQSYEYIKAKGLNDKFSKPSEVEKKIEQHKKTVPSPQVYDKRPMAQAFNPSREDYLRIKEEQMRTYNEMKGYANQTGMGY